MKKGEKCDIKIIEKKILMGGMKSMYKKVKKKEREVKMRDEA